MCNITLCNKKYKMLQNVSICKSIKYIATFTHSSPHQTIFVTKHVTNNLHSNYHKTNYLQPTKRQM